MIPTEQIVAKHLSRVGASDRFAVIVFGSNYELNVFLNALPNGWKFVTATLARDNNSAASAVFEINPQPKGEDQ